MSETNTETGKDEGATRQDVRSTGLVSRDRDWQITTILLNNLYIETDCNSGVKRRIRKSRANAATQYLLNTTRPDSEKEEIMIEYLYTEGAGICSQKSSVPGLRYRNARL